MSPKIFRKTKQWYKNEFDDMISTNTPINFINGIITKI